MKRIEVSNSWKSNRINTSFKMVFDEVTDMHKAFEAMKVAIEEVETEGSCIDLWIQDLGDCVVKNNFDIEGAFCCEEFPLIIKAMVNAIAKEMPSTSFRGYAEFDALNCYYVDDIEFTFGEGLLHFKETFFDDEIGYFCPNCGCFVAYAGEELDSDDFVECDDCEKSIKVSELNYVPPIVTEESISF